MQQKAVHAERRGFGIRARRRLFGLKAKLWLSLGMLLLIALTILQIEQYRLARTEVLESLRLQARTLKTVMLSSNRIFHELALARLPPSTEHSASPAFDAIPAHSLARVASELRDQGPAGLWVRVIGLERPGAARPLDAQDAEALAYFERYPDQDEYATRLVDTAGHRFYSYAQPIWTESYCLTCHGDAAAPALASIGARTPATGFREGDLRGLFSIRLPIDQIEQRIFEQFSRSLAGHLMVFLILFIVAGMLLQRVVIDKLYRLQHAVRGFADGHYAQHVRVEGRDEIADLADDFNRMADRIAERDRQLSESEERLRLFIDTAPVAIAMLDRDQRYLAVSPRWLEQFQLNEVIGREHDGLFPALGPQWREATRHALAGEVVEHDNDSYSRQDGETRWLRWSVRPWYRQDDAVGGVVIFCEDITARYQAETALQQANRYNRGLLEAHLDPLFVIDNKGLIDDVNVATELATGRTREELLGTQVADYFTDPAGAIASYREAFAKGRLQDCPLEILHRDGEQHMPVLCNATVYRDQAGGVQKLFGAARNITDVKRYTDMLQARMRLIEQAPSQSITEILKASIDEAKALTNSHAGFYHFLEPDGATLSLQVWSIETTAESEQRDISELSSCPLGKAGMLADCVQTRRTVIANYPVVQPNLRSATPAQAFVTRMLATPVIRDERVVAILSVADQPRDYDDADRRVVSAFADLAWSIVEAKRIEAALRASEARNREIIETANEGIWIMDKQRQIRFVNRQMAVLLGYEVNDILGRQLDDFLFPEDVASCRAHYQDLIAGRSQHFERRFRRRDGSQLWTLVSAVARTDESGNAIGSFAMFTDITQIKEQQQRLEALAHFDPLTGLPNRALLADRMRLALAQTRRSHALLAVCYLDLDGFKPVNDTYGHEAGDRLLIAVAKRLLGTVRADDTVARLGGDEFVLLLGHLSNRAECRALMARVLDAIADPYELAPSTSIAVSASIGLTLYPRDRGDADELLRHADMALYQAKEAGRGCFRFFEDGVSSDN